MTSVSDLKLPSSSFLGCGGLTAEPQTGGAAKQMIIRDHVRWCSTVALEFITAIYDTLPKASEVNKKGSIITGEKEGDRTMDVSIAYRAGYIRRAFMGMHECRPRSSIISLSWPKTSS